MPPNTFPPGHLGLELQPRRSNNGRRIFCISTVDAGGPAHSKGLLVGDVLVSVDEMHMDGWRFEDVAVLLQGEVGTWVKLRVYQKQLRTFFNVMLQRERQQGGGASGRRGRERGGGGRVRRGSGSEYSGPDDWGRFEAASCNFTPPAAPQVLYNGAEGWERERGGGGRARRGSGGGGGERRESARRSAHRARRGSGGGGAQGWAPPTHARLRDLARAESARESERERARERGRESARERERERAREGGGRQRRGSGGGGAQERAPRPRSLRDLERAEGARERERERARGGGGRERRGSVSAGSRIGERRSVVGTPRILSPRQSVGSRGSDGAGSAARGSQRVPDAFLCPIMHEIMRDPVLVVETGHTYERLAILEWFRQHSTDPKTNQQLSSKAVVPNHGLRASIDEYFAS
mmetsp:Transcript_83588/g.125347  ORF Transcript_83588/g.125347 Transcript_83588/m.125347 type:complete len:411 (-) Transcript_83588:234-1466(-)